MGMSSGVPIFILANNCEVCLNERWRGVVRQVALLTFRNASVLVRNAE